MQMVEKEEIEKVYKKLGLANHKRDVIPKENRYHEFTHYDMTKKNRSIVTTTDARLKKYSLY